MKFTNKQIEAVFDLYYPIFELNLPFVWDKTKDKSMLGFHLIEDFGTGTEMHFIALNFSLIEDEIMLHETIAHELVHAWQYEQGFETEHGQDFAAWCAYFNIHHGLNIASEDVLIFDIFSAHCHIAHNLRDYRKAA